MTIRSLRFSRFKSQDESRHGGFKKVADGRSGITHYLALDPSTCSDWTAFWLEASQVGISQTTIGSTLSSSLDTNSFGGTKWHQMSPEESWAQEKSGNRVTRWRRGSSHGEVVAGGKGRGDNLDQLNGPLGILLVKKDGCWA